MQYQSQPVKPKKNTNKRKTIVTVVVVAFVVGGGLLWWFRYRTPATQIVTRAGNIPKSTPANSASTPPSKKQPTDNAGRTISGGTDTNGQTNADTNSSQWITSKSGNITVEQPIADATLQSGSALSGTAKVSTVHYRLIDNSVGVISEGTLNIASGKFSGNLNFTSHSSTGQLDVFSTDANGVEINEIQIAVKF
jgi:cytoskeletal protein RodZ